MTYSIHEREIYLYHIFSYSLQLSAYNTSTHNSPWNWVSFLFYPLPSKLKGYLFHLSNGTIYTKYQVWCLSSLCRESRLVGYESKLEFNFRKYLWILQKCILSKYNDSAVHFAISFENFTFFSNNNFRFPNHQMIWVHPNREKC